MTPAACTPGRILHPLEERIGESGLLFGLRIFFLRQREPKEGRVFRNKPGIDVGELHETARQQTRAAQKHERKRDFDDNERTPQPSARAAFGGAARALFQRFVHVGARGEPRGRNPKHQPGDNAEREREEQHAGIEMNVADSGQIRGRKREQRVESPARQQHAGQATANREHNAFGEKLANEPGAARRRARRESKSRGAARSRGPEAGWRCSRRR